MKQVISIGLTLLLLVSAASSWSWLNYAKHPTTKHRDMAAMFTGWAFAVIGVMALYQIVTLRS